MFSQYLTKKCTVVDLGCGLGDFYRYLTSEVSFEGQYLGLDCLREFIEFARATSPDTFFQVFDATKDTYTVDYQWWCISGMFNNLFLSRPDHLMWMHSILEKAFSACGVGIAFNFLSTKGSDQYADLYYRDPDDVVRWCIRNLSTELECRDDYNKGIKFSGATDFTIIVFK